MFLKFDGSEVLPADLELPVRVRLLSCSDNRQCLWVWTRFFKEVHWGVAVSGGQLKNSLQPHFSAPSQLVQRCVLHYKPVRGDPTPPEAEEGEDVVETPLQCPATTDGSWRSRQLVPQRRQRRYLCQWWLTAQPGTGPALSWSWPDGSLLWILPCLSVGETEWGHINQQEHENNNRSKIANFRGHCVLSQHRISARHPKKKQQVCVKSSRNCFFAAAFTAAG